MQTGFAMLEAGLNRQRGVVNALLENFINAARHHLSVVGNRVWDCFWYKCWRVNRHRYLFPLVSYLVLMVAIYWLHQALQPPSIPIPCSSSSLPLLLPLLRSLLVQWLEETDFIGDLIYSAIMGAIAYPIVVHWVWNSDGWLSKLSYHDFAGSSVVHTVGGWTAR